MLTAVKGESGGGSKSNGAGIRASSRDAMRPWRRDHAWIGRRYPPESLHVEAIFYPSLVLARIFLSGVPG
jgi:hypothetical protein